MFEALAYDWAQRAVAAGLLASIACGVIGTYVVVKRMVFISGGVAHASLGGIGIAAWLGIQPLYGAIAFSLVSALGLGVVSMRGRERPDTLIGALWAIGMAIGILFLNMTPGYAVNLESYLFGNILLVSPWDLRMILALDALVLAVVWCFFKEFLAISLDDEFAELRGLPVRTLYLLLLCLIALTVVIMIRVVGIILVIALLSLPPAISRWYTRRIPTMMLASCALGAAFTLTGIALSFATDLPSGACIVLTAGAAYALLYPFRG